MPLQSLCPVLSLSPVGTGDSQGLLCPISTVAIPMSRPIPQSRGYMGIPRTPLSHQYRCNPYVPSYPSVPWVQGIPKDSSVPPVPLQSLCPVLSLSPVGTGDSLGLLCLISTVAIPMFRPIPQSRGYRGFPRTPLSHQYRCNPYVPSYPSVPWVHGNP